MVQKTRATEPVRVALVSLGCAKNLIDSEVILGRVGAGPYQIVRDPEAADVAVVNTCGFIDAAREESLRTIEEMLLLKRRGVLQGVLVAGCMVKRFRDELLTKLPEVDAFLDISDYADVVGAIEGLRRGRRVKHLRGGRAKSGTTDLGRALLTPEHFAYLRVSEGCDYKCTFCVIPHIRGLHVSKPLPVLAQEAAELAELGVKEIALVGEDITSYGKDIGLRGGLVPLLQALSLVEGIEWIRLLYTHPPVPSTRCWTSSSTIASWCRTSTCRSSTSTTRS
ncbi:MAG: radical SAM protein [Planctomycetota bacterium]